VTLSRNARLALKVVAGFLIPALAYFLVRSEPLGIIMHPVLGTAYVSMLLYMFLLGIRAGLTAIWVGGCLLRVWAVPPGQIGTLALLVALAVLPPLAIWWYVLREDRIWNP
jgi:hypothetical protein